MRVIDYNGQDRWSRDAVITRYNSYSERYGFAPERIVPREFSDGRTTWIYPVMHEIIARIETGDRAAAEIGVELLEESGSFPFGRILKSNSARALRRCTALTPELEARIRTRIVSMLASGYLPREFRQYAKLARRVGVQRELQASRALLNLENPWVAHYYELLR